MNNPYDDAAKYPNIPLLMRRLLAEAWRKGYHAGREGMLTVTSNEPYYATGQPMPYVERDWT